MTGVLQDEGSVSASVVNCDRTDNLQFFGLGEKACDSGSKALLCLPGTSWAS